MKKYKQYYTIFIFVFAFLFSSLAVQCSFAEKTKTYTHIVTSDSNYYMSGPQQSRPPEGKFKTGTKVNVIQDSGSYSLVESENGVKAYVSTTSLKTIKSK